MGWLWIRGRKKYGVDERINFECQDKLSAFIQKIIKFMKVEIYETKIWDWNIQDSISKFISDRENMSETYSK